jgi:hypothetical protein
MKILMTKIKTFRFKFNLKKFSMEEILEVLQVLPIIIIIIIIKEI